MGKFHIESSTQEKFLRIKIDNNFNFASYVENLCKNASRKIHALAKISPYMSLIKQRSLLNAFLYPSSVTALSHGCTIPEP